MCSEALANPWLAILSVHAPQSASTPGLHTDLPKPLVTHPDCTGKMFPVKNTFPKARASPRKSLVQGIPTFCQGGSNQRGLCLCSSRHLSPTLPSTTCPGGCSCTPTLEPHSPGTARGHCQQQGTGSAWSVKGLPADAAQACSARMWPARPGAGLSPG